MSHAGGLIGYICPNGRAARFCRRKPARFTCRPAAGWEIFVRRIDRQNHQNFGSGRAKPIIFKSAGLCAAHPVSRLWFSLFLSPLHVMAGRASPCRAVGVSFMRGELPDAAFMSRLRRCRKFRRLWPWCRAHCRGSCPLFPPCAACHHGQRCGRGRGGCRAIGRPNGAS